MRLQNAINDVKTRYGSAADFMRIFNKDIQPQTALYPARAHLGTAPSMALVRSAYNDEVLVTWIMAQLEDINDFAGTSIKMSLDQMEQLARVISTEYYYLKVTELHLFLHRLKAGRYGFFYGAIDPMKITSSLATFSEERRIEIARIENEKSQAEIVSKRHEWSKTAISRQEYERIKNSQNAA